jgi:hypothetical protein
LSVKIALPRIVNEAFDYCTDVQPIAHYIQPESARQDEGFRHPAETA